MDRYSSFSSFEVKTVLINPNKNFAAVKIHFPHKYVGKRGQ